MSLGIPCRMKGIFLNSHELRNYVGKDKKKINQVQSLYNPNKVIEKVGGRGISFKYKRIIKYVGYLQ